MDGFTFSSDDERAAAEDAVARLRLEDARIHLQCAAKTRGTSACVLYAPSKHMQHDLLRRAISDVGITAGYFDATRIVNVANLNASLKSCDNIIVLDDPSFRTAPYSMAMVISAREQRAGLPPIVIRIGAADPNDDTKFYLSWSHSMTLPELNSWTTVPLFLMEAVAENVMEGRS